MLKMVLIYVVLGFCAELVDGTAGMAYGVCSNTFLRLAGIPSAVSSACVHCAEMFTTAVSGISHFKLGNFNKKLFFMLLFPGVLGGALGAYLLVDLPFGNTVDVVIDVYLIIMGIVIITKAFKASEPKESFGRYAIPLGFIGGFSDSLGGGGWGPIVSSTLLASGHKHTETIGTVNAVEFFVTVAETTAFFVLLGNFGQFFYNVLGLIIGGVIAAPLGAYLCKKIKTKYVLIFVGVLIIVLNCVKLRGHLF